MDVASPKKANPEEAQPRHDEREVRPLSNLQRYYWVTFQQVLSGSSSTDVASSADQSNIDGAQGHENSLTASSLRPTNTFETDAAQAASMS